MAAAAEFGIRDLRPFSPVSIVVAISDNQRQELGAIRERRRKRAQAAQGRQPA